MKKTILIPRDYRNKHVLTPEMIQEMQRIAASLQSHLQEKVPTLMCSSAPLVVAETEHLQQSLHLDCFTSHDDLSAEDGFRRLRLSSLPFLREMCTATDTLIIVTHGGFVAASLKDLCRSIGIDTIDSLDAIDLVAQSDGIILAHDCTQPFIDTIKL